MVPDDKTTKWDYKNAQNCCVSANRLQGTRKARYSGWPNDEREQVIQDMPVKGKVYVYEAKRKIQTSHRVLSPRYLGATASLYIYIHRQISNKNRNLVYLKPEIFDMDK